MAKNASSGGEIHVSAPSITTFSIRVIGSRPLIFNRMSEKAKRMLLIPTGRKTAVERAASTKHDPLDEFRNSVYRSKDKKSPTYLLLPSPAFKGALTTAALDTPGVFKSEIGRLCWVNSDYVNIYGIPQFLMSVVRSADAKKTPDIRTRAIVKHWCAEVSISFTRPKLSEESIINLLVGAGILCGVGDFRQEKGKGNYGQFRVVANNKDDAATYAELVKTGGRAAQVAAMNEANPFDDDSLEMLSWWTTTYGTRSKADQERAV